MADYYVDPVAVGANDGTSWADAWTTLQTAADTAVAGDTVYCRGGEVLAATIDFDINSGAIDNKIFFIGCNAAGDNDGTPYELDGNSAAVNCMFLNSINYIVFINFSCYSATGDGVSISGGTSHTFINFGSSTNGAHGFDVGGRGNMLFYRCTANNNTSSGFYQLGTDCMAVLSEAIGNGSRGYYLSSPNVICYGCVSSDNTSEAYRCDNTSAIFNCVADSSSIGISQVAGIAAFIIGNRITNNTAQGLNFSRGIACCNFSNNNGTDLNITGSGIGFSNETVGTQGYVDAASDNFTTGDSATLRNESVQVGVSF